MYVKTIYLLLFMLGMVSCNNKSLIVNENINYGKLNGDFQLTISDTKIFMLDSITAPKPIYLQLIDGSDGKVLTFLNEYNHKIYFYDYADGAYQKTLSYDDSSKNNLIRKAGGYYIHNMDSIYVYDMSVVGVSLIDSLGHLKNKYILHDAAKDWPYHYPQYMLSAVNPILKCGDQLILTGQYFPSLTSGMINKFKFSSIINMKTNEIEYKFVYPAELFGFDANWEGGLSTTVYPELLVDGSIIHSYTVSHNIYKHHVSSVKPSLFYAGSSKAKSIKSIEFADVDNTPQSLTFSHYLQRDVYTAIKYDPYRKVYYRFLLGAVPEATSNTPKEEKLISIVIMDDDFNYLGETLVGTGWEWNWMNSFVTEEGLNIEYIDENSDESYLMLKIFTLKKI